MGFTERSISCPEGTHFFLKKLFLSRSDFKFSFHSKLSFYSSHIRNSSSLGTLPTRVLNVGVTNVNYTVHDMGSFVSSESRYAIGASYSRYKREFKSKTGGGSRVADMELLFQRTTNRLLD